MWVSKTEWQALNDRVQKLEREAQGIAVFPKYLEHRLYLAAPEDATYVSYYAAIQMILRHLGLRLTQTKATPATTTLEKIPEPTPPWEVIHIKPDAPAKKRARRK